MKTPPILCRKETDEYTKADDNTRGRTEPQIRNRYGNGGSHCKKENRQTGVTVWRHTEFLMPEANTQSPLVILGATRLLYHMSNIFQDNSLPRLAPTERILTASAGSISSESNWLPVKPWMIAQIPRWIRSTYLCDRTLCTPPPTAGAPEMYYHTQPNRPQLSAGGRKERQ